MQLKGITYFPEHYVVSTVSETSMLTSKMTGNAFSFPNQCATRIAVQ